MSKINTGALENIFRALFSALTVTKMEKSEVDSILNNLVDEDAPEDVSKSEPIVVKKVGNTLVLSGNFNIQD